MVRNYLRKMMAGRCGVDPLSVALLLSGSVISLIVSLFRGIFRNVIYTSQAAYILFMLLSFLPYIPYAIAFFRIFSRNIPKRCEENAAFMKVAGRWIAYFSKKSRQKKDRLHRYYDCPGCHRTLRVPKGRGKIKIDCPHCGRQFTKRT